jgi:flagellar motor switch protein FliN/FliY
MTTASQFEAPSNDLEGEPQPDKGGAPKNGAPLVSLDSELFRSVEVALHAKLQPARLTVSEVLALRAGSVVTLEARMSDLIELRLNDATVARGEIVAVGDHFGIRIVEIADHS